MILTTPIFAKYAPLSATISVVGADIGIACLALVYWGFDLAQLSGWGFFVAGLFGIVMTAGGSSKAQG